MEILKYPTAEAVDKIIAEGEPLLAVIAFDGKSAIVADMDEAMEHHILLARAGKDDRDIDKYFRIIFNDEGADWAFICPPNYKDIPDKVRRITAFYKDGFDIISDFLMELGLMVGISIPRRYRRHLEVFKDE